MNTPTKKSPALGSTPLAEATPELILSSAELIASDAHESISQTLDRALASPAKRSPFFDIQVGEALEAFIEGSPINTDQTIEGIQTTANCFTSPTVQRQSLSQ